MDHPESPELVLPYGEDLGRRRRVAFWTGIGFLILVVLGGCTLAQPVLTRRGQAAHLADPARLERDVRALSETFAPRDWLHPENLDRAAEYLKTEFQSTGARVREQTYTVKDKTYRNVIARFGPEGGEPIVVGAHYDAFEELPGADDNASGVAGLLELARLLSRQPLKAPVELVAYTLEEPPFFGTKNMGSAQHAVSLRDRGVRLRGVLVLEMIGFFSDAKGSQDYPMAIMRAFYPSRGNFIAVVSNYGSLGLTRRVKKAMTAASDLPVRSMNAPAFIPGVDFSDHHPYWDAGYDAVMITDSAFNRNRAYHTPGDTADRLDYRRMAKVVEGVLEAVRRMDQN